MVSVPVTLSRPLTGRDIRITVTASGLEDTVNYDSQLAQTMPIGIAEVGIPGIRLTGADRHSHMVPG